MQLSRARRRLSIGARITLTSAGVMLLAIGVLALVVFVSIQRKVREDAVLILRYYVSEVVDEIGEAPAGLDAAGVAKWVVEATLERLERLDGSLRPSLAIFNEEGKLLAAEGILAKRPVPLPPTLIGGATQEVVSSAKLGAPYPYLVAAVPAPRGFLQVAIYSKRFERDLGGIRGIFEVTGPLILLLSGAGGWWISRRSLRPIAEITATARRIRGDKLDTQIAVAGTNDELDQLAVTLNEMIARIRSSMEKLRRVSGDAAHQLRSPLASLRNRLEITLEMGVADASHRADLEAVLAQVVELSDGVAAMLQLARSEAGLEPGQARPVDLARLIEAVVALYAPVAEERRIRLEHDVNVRASVLGDPSWLAQMLGNLLDNAIRYTEPGGWVLIELLRAGDEAIVRIADSGRGIPPDELERIFERFHRGGLGRETTGFGLGLAVAREIAREHGGRIEVQSRLGIGSVFTVHLPESEKPTSA